MKGRLKPDFRRPEFFLSNQMFRQESQCVFDGLRPYCFAIACEKRGLLKRAFGRGQAEPDCADRFGRAAAARAGDAGNTQGVICLRDGFCAASHFIDGLAANRAVFQQGIGHDTEAVLFGLVAVCDEALVKPLRAAGEGSQRTCKQAAGAGLGAGNGLTAAGQVFGDGLQMGHGGSLWKRVEWGGRLTRRVSDGLKAEIRLSAE